MGCLKGRHRYGNLCTFAELRRHHARFHHLAREIVVLTRAEREREASELFHGEFEQASSGGISLLRGMEPLFES